MLPLAGKLVGTERLLQRRDVVFHSIDEFLQTLLILRCDIDAIQDTPPGLTEKRFISARGVYEGWANVECLLRSQMTIVSAPVE